MRTGLHKCLSYGQTDCASAALNPSHLAIEFRHDCPLISIKNNPAFGYPVAS
jgi:hypothetical protein